MKRIPLLIVIILVGIGFIHAQKLEVESMEQCALDLSGSFHARRDSHGQHCALVKVSVTLPNVTFRGKVVGDVNRDGSDYWVYMSQGATELQISHQDYGNITITFSKHDITPLEGRTTYLIRLTKSIDFPKTNECMVDIPAVRQQAKNAYDNEAYQESLDLYMTIAHDAEAQHHIGRICYLGHGGESNYIEASKWFRKAAEQGYAVVQNNLGTMYEYGYGVIQDYIEAVRWFQKAENQGYEPAAEKLNNNSR